MTGVKCPTENQEQRALVKWVKLQPKIRDFMLKLNNEGQRSEAQGWNLKLMGMLPGASDLFLAYPVGKYHGLWIEMKRNMRYTPSQMKSETWIGQEIFQERMRSVGFAAKFCYGWEEAARVIQSYLRGSDEFQNGNLLL